MRTHKLLRRFTALLLAVLLLTCSAFAAFSDTEGHWAGESIDAMVELGVLKGYPDGSFHPNGTLTRAEFLTMCVRYALGEPEPAGQELPGGLWWTPYRAAAENAQWSIPFESDAETMGKPVTRQEMAVLLSDAVSAVTYQREPAIDPTYPVLHQELAEMADYAILEEELQNGGGLYYSAMNQCVQLGLIGGYPDGECKPLRTLSRAEAATVLCRLDRARAVWAEGGRFVVFGDDLCIWQTWDENGTVLHSAKNGEIISEIAVDDRAAESPFRFDILGAGGGNLWGECGLYTYDDDGTLTQLTDLPVIDFGYDPESDSTVFLTHDPAARVIETIGGIWVHGADTVVRLHRDGSIETLLSAEARGRITLNGEPQPGVLTKVEKVTDGDVWVTLRHGLGMMDEGIFRVVIQDGEGVIVPTGLAGNGYSY